LPASERDIADRARLTGLLSRERAIWRRGVHRIAGVDEAGLGPLAGPVVAAAVIMPPRRGILGVDDSKKLTARQRTSLEVEIRAQAVAVGIGLAEVEEIAQINIYQAGLLAMRRALDHLAVPPEMVLLDARRLPDLPWPQEALIRGDAQIHCVACASIVAKVFRDRLMEEYDRLYPGYGFARHKGYATAAHRSDIAARGPCPIHRRGFRGAGAQPDLFAWRMFLPT
jgi:ribonuclease HII